MSQLVTVIGGAGFVGTRLCSLLGSSGHPFLIVDKRRSETFPDATVIADVRDRDQLMRVLPRDSVWINLAAEHRDDVSPKSLYDEVNVQGARNICQAAVDKDIRRIVFTSSVACYGFAPPATGEDGLVAPINDYGRTKLLAEGIFRQWQEGDADSRSLAIIRPTVIFGERNRGNVYNLLRQIAMRRFAMVGDGTNIKSMAYVGNVASFIEMLAAGRNDNVLVNYVDDPSIDMNTLVSIAREEMGFKPEIGLRLPVWLGMVLGHAADLVAFVSKKKLPLSAVRVRKFVSDSHFTSNSRGLGFEPPYSVVEALRRTVKFEFVSDNKDGPVFYSE